MNCENVIAASKEDVLILFESNDNEYILYNSENGTCVKSKYAVAFSRFVNLYEIEKNKIDYYKELIKKLEDLEIKDINN